MNYIRYKVEAEEPNIRQQKIPRVIYQTWKSNLVGDNMYNNSQKWIQQNPTYEYQFFDDQAIQDYVYNFDCTGFTFTAKELQQAYDSINPGAGRADIFRYCILYANGGIYADFDSECLVPLDNYIDSTADVVLLINAWHKQHVHHTFAQWFLAYTKFSGIIKLTLELTVRSILTRTPVDIFGNTHSLLERYTGPAVYNSIIFDTLRFKPLKSDVIDSLKEKTYRLPLKNQLASIQFLYYLKDQPKYTHVSRYQYKDHWSKYLRFKYKSFFEDLKTENLTYWPHLKVFNE